MTQKTGRFGASGREFCLYSLEKEDIEETLQLMDRCVGENLYQKEDTHHMWTAYHNRLRSEALDGSQWYIIKMSKGKRSR